MKPINLHDTGKSDTLDEVIADLQKKIGDPTRPLDEIDLDLLATKDDLSNLELQVVAESYGKDVLTIQEFTSNSVYIYKIGNLVLISMHTYMTSGAAKGSWSLFTLPGNLRPSATRQCAMYVTNSDTNMTLRAHVAIQANGAVVLSTDTLPAIRVAGMIAYTI